VFLELHLDDKCHDDLLPYGIEMVEQCQSRFIACPIEIEPDIGINEEQFLRHEIASLMLSAQINDASRSDNPSLLKYGAMLSGDVMVDSGGKRALCCVDWIGSHRSQMERKLAAKAATDARTSDIANGTM
jgi:hypothetical protein